MAKENLIVFQSLSYQLLGTKSLQYLHNNNQLREILIVDSCYESEEKTSSAHVDDHDLSSESNEHSSCASSASDQKREGTKDVSSNNAFVDNIISPFAKRREMRE